MNKKQTNKQKHRDYEQLGWWIHNDAYGHRPQKYTTKINTNMINLCERLIFFLSDGA